MKETVPRAPKTVRSHRSLAYSDSGLASDRCTPVLIEAIMASRTWFFRPLGAISSSKMLCASASRAASTTARDNGEKRARPVVAAVLDSDEDLQNHLLPKTFEDDCVVDLDRCGAPRPFADGRRGVRGAAAAAMCCPPFPVRVAQPGRAVGGVADARRDDARTPGAEARRVRSRDPVMNTQIRRACAPGRVVR